MYPQATVPKLERGQLKLSLYVDLDAVFYTRNDGKFASTRVTAISVLLMSFNLLPLKACCQG